MSENNIRVSKYLDDIIPEYVDIIINNDTLDEKRFLDLYTIIHMRFNTVGYDFKERILKKVQTFFEEILKAIINDDEDKHEYLSNNLHEAKYTKLGYSISGPGKALGKEKYKKLIDSLKSSEAFKTDSIEDILDTELYIKDVGVDIISDLITNLIQDILSEYTEKTLNNLAMGDKIRYINTHYWDENDNKWVNKDLAMLNYKYSFDCSKEYNYLLVPNSFTSDSYQKERIIKNVFDNCIFNIFESKILSDKSKYSNYIGKNETVFKYKVIEFIKNELGESCSTKDNKYITSHGLMSLVKRYPEIKEYINDNIKK
ncbi:hypothetical protein QYB79_003050 [Clostridium perfringens]|nr:hypothetical protein [Clostridium perfringens]ELC8440976.1 hypothetical protein [Clostridium perfringens]